MPSYITLTRGYVATVDDADFESLNRYHWHAEPNGKTVYAARRHAYISLSGKSRVKTWYMHWQILGGPQPGCDVHHLDGNGLNNQRSNLSSLSPSEHAKTHGPIAGSSHFKGVSWESRKQRWRVQVRATDGNKRLYQGYFKTEEEAARAYDRAALEHFGPGAYQNFPNQGPS